MEYPFSDARLASVWKSMALHSKYLGSFETVHQFLLAGDGPLPIVDRHYIAIMVTTTYLPHFIDYLWTFEQELMSKNNFTVA